jgi:hypothetical protein
VRWAGALALTLAASTLPARPGSASSAPVPATPAAITPEVSLDLQRCSRLPRAEIVRLVGLELDARVVAPGGGGPHATRGVIACGVDSVRLEVSDPLAGTFLSRTLPFPASAASAASRIAALALAELVFASWLELAQPRPRAATADAPPRELRRAALERAQRHASAPPAPAAAPAVEPTPAPPAEAEVAAPPTAPPAVVPAAPVSTAAAVLDPIPSRPDAIYVLALGQATGPFRGIGLAWGAGVRLGWTSGATLFTVAAAPAGLAGDLELAGAWTDVDSAAGSVRVSTWSAAPRASLRVNLNSGRSAWLDVGAGARLGVARLVGAPTDPTSFRGGSLAGTWAGAAGYAGIGVSLRSVVIAAGVEGGQVLRSVSGMVDGERSVSVAGRWLSGSLALGWGRGR